MAYGVNPRNGTWSGVGAPQDGLRTDENPYQPVAGEEEGGGGAPPPPVPKPASSGVPKVPPRSSTAGDTAEYNKPQPPMYPGAGGDQVEQVYAPTAGASPGQDFETFYNQGISSGQIGNQITKAQWKVWWDQGLFAGYDNKGQPQWKITKEDENGNPIGGVGEHPDICPPGTTAYGPRQCLRADHPKVQGQGGGGAGGGYGGQGGQGQGGGYGYGGAPPGMSDAELSMLSAITDMARMLEGEGGALFGVGMPAYQQATDYYQKVLGLKGRAGVQEAIAPVASQIADAARGARAQIVAGGARGAARDIGLSEIARQQVSDISSVASNQAKDAAAGLERTGEFGVATGLQTQGMAAGQLEAVRGALTQDRQFEEGQDLQRDLTGQSLEAQWSIANLNARTTKDIAVMQDATNREQIAAQREIAQADIAQRASQFAANMEYQYAQLGQQWKMFDLQRKDEKAKQKSGFWGKLAGVAIGGAIGFITGGPAGAAMGAASTFLGSPNLTYKKS